MAPSAITPPEQSEYVAFHAGKGVVKREVLKGNKAKPTFESIPIVDFSMMNSSSLADRKSVAQEVGRAFKEVGFLYAKNHGISEELQGELLTAMKQFFDLPLEEKMKIHVNLSPTIKGYEALLETKLDQSTRGDLKEAFAMENDPYDAETKPPANLNWSQYQKGNQWPEGLPDFRKVMYEYNDAILGFAKNLMRMIALALDLHEDYFDNMSDFPMAGLRALHYPPQQVSGDVGIGAHADYSWFTLVNQLTSTTALEVLNHNAQWIPAPPIPNTLVCNVGDFLERATNEVFTSTVHRVVNRTGEERYSIPYFFSPSPDVILDVLPSCKSRDNPPKYEAVRAGDWQRERLLRARYKHPSSIAARERGEI